MKHFLEIKNYGLRLRPITLEDAEFICQLRNEEQNSRYIGSTSNRVIDQIKWIEAYLSRDNDYYFCVEKENGERLGTIAIYDIKEGKAEWGRWILKDKNLYSPTTVLLIFQIAFDVLKLNSVYCRTVIENKKVLSFHENVGLKQISIEADSVVINDKLYSLVIHELLTENFEMVKEKLIKLAEFSKRFL